MAGLRSLAGRRAVTEFKRELLSLAAAAAGCLLLSLTPAAPWRLRSIVRRWRRRWRQRDRVDEFDPMKPVRQFSNKVAVVLPKGALG
jgi:hypothetical protein